MKCLSEHVQVLNSNLEKRKKNYQVAVTKGENLQQSFANEADPKSDSQVRSLMNVADKLNYY